MTPSPPFNGPETWRTFCRHMGVRATIAGTTLHQAYYDAAHAAEVRFHGADVTPLAGESPEHLRGAIREPLLVACARMAILAHRSPAAADALADLALAALGMTAALGAIELEGAHG